jgi:UDP-glucose 4-epimerase
LTKIFISGGAGFIGSHLAEELAGFEDSIVIYDNLSTGSLDNIKSVSHELIHGDILDYGLLRKSMKGCETVYHLAAATSVIESIDNPEKYIDINFKGTMNILNAAKENGVKKVLIASSAAVYGDSPELPKIESMTPDPKSIYAVTKLDGEYLCNIYKNVNGIDYVAARFFNVFGERQDPNSPYAAAVPIFLAKILNNEPITIYGDGEQTRDFIYVKDIIKAMVFLMNHGFGIYNIGYGQVISVNSLVKLLMDYAKMNVKVEHVQERSGEIKHSYASVEKLRQCGFEPSFNLEQGLRRTTDWWKSRHEIRHYS